MSSRRLSPRAYQRITLLALLALGFIIVTGGGVRLTGSGLGCPKWPACTATRFVAPNQFHAQVEFINRMVTGVVSVAVMVAALGAFVRAPRRRDLTWLSSGLVVGIIAQIVLGGLTVRHRLNPAFVMAHFLLSMVIVWDAVVLHDRATIEGERRVVDRTRQWIGRAMVGWTALTVVLGTVVTGAGPHSGANSADGIVARWQLDLHRITQLHGTSAMLLLALVVATNLSLRSSAAPAVTQHRARQALEALAFQVAVGYAQYFTGVPVLLVSFHLLGAVLVWVAVLRFALVAGSGPFLWATTSTERVTVA